MDDREILEEGEYCAVCLTANNLGSFDDMITVCQDCYTNEKFRDFLASEMEKALAASPNHEKTPEGGYRRIA